MSELTKEFFEQYIKESLADNNKNLVTREYLEVVLDQKFEENNKNLVTKEYFDEKTKGFVTFNQVGAQLIILDKHFDEKLTKMSDDLKQHTEGLQEELAQMVAHGFVDVISRLDVRDRVNKLETRMAWLEQQVGT